MAYFPSYVNCIIVMIIQPDGRVCDPYVALWPDVEEAEKAMLDECKAEAATKATNQES